MNFQLFAMLIYISYLAPASGPYIFVMILNSTECLVQIEPPDAMDQNGIITAFHLSFVGNPFDSATTTIIISITNQTYPMVGFVEEELRGLQEGNMYTFSATAINSAGESLISNIETASKAPMGEYEVWTSYNIWA